MREVCCREFEGSENAALLAADLQKRVSFCRIRIQNGRTPEECPREMNEDVRRAVDTIAADISSMIEAEDRAHAEVEFDYAAGGQGP